MGYRLRTATLAGLALVVSACGVHQATTAAPTGPSAFGTTVSMTATPDRISQDGASQSTIVVTVIDQNGAGKGSQTLSLAMVVNGTVQDFGTLSTRTVTTGSDGKATAIFTAPPTPLTSVGSGTTVVIAATLIANDAVTSNPRTVEIRLVPPGVILPPPDTPTAVFQFSPASAVQNQSILFDGTASCGGTISANTCQSSSQIVSFNWNFGDGTSGSGATVSHGFGNVSIFTVTLTVTNDRGVSASTTKLVPVSTSPGPTARFTFSPATIHSGGTVFFNATSSTATPGRSIRRYDWDFGDGTLAQNAGPTPQHTYTTLNTFNVTLVVTDDIGQSASVSQPVTVVP
jgi:PKD repeat protein